MEMKINEFDMFCDFRERKVKREEGVEICQLGDASGR